jgi:hypothetical protein
VHTSTGNTSDAFFLSEEYEQVWEEELESLQYEITCAQTGLTAEQVNQIYNASVTQTKTGFEVNTATLIMLFTYFLKVLPLMFQKR